MIKDTCEMTGHGLRTLVDVATVGVKSKVERLEGTVANAARVLSAIDEDPQIVQSKAFMADLRATLRECKF
jgi:hypothetical protein